MKKLKKELVKSFSLFLMMVFFASIIAAQKKPLSVNLDTNSDDDRLCGFSSGGGKFDNDGKIAGSEFCSLYSEYKGNKNGNEIGRINARNARNEMIQLVRGQIDSYYKFRKDGRSTKIRVFQTILDFLQIGGNLAATIMNGKRGINIVNASLAGIATGQTKFNKNFEVLNTQVLINKMNAKRALIFTEIVGKMDEPVYSPRYAESYDWYSAKNDLRRYLLAGTFDDALDELVKETGKEVDNAEAKLRAVEKRPIVREFTTDDTKLVDDADDVLATFQEKLEANANDKETIKKLNAIIEKLKEVQQFRLFFAGRNINAQTKGKDLYTALIDLRRELFIATDLSSIRTVEGTIIQLGK